MGIAYKREILHRLIFLNRQTLANDPRVFTMQLEEMVEDNMVSSCYADIQRMLDLLGGETRFRVSLK